MPFACSTIEDRQFKSFKVDGNGDVCRRVCVTEGSFQPTGLTTSGLITNVPLSKVAWTALPATALSGRNAIGIQNPVTNSNTVLLNFSAAAPLTDGWRIEPGGEYFTDITDSIVLYALNLASLTPAETITVMEIA